MLAATLDPDGRRVVLTEERWRHILGEHPEMAQHMRSVMTAVREPTLRLSGEDPGEEYYYVEGEGPSRWVKAVVHFEGGEGRIITAFPRRSVP